MSRLADGSVYDGSSPPSNPGPYADTPLFEGGRIWMKHVQGGDGDIIWSWRHLSGGKTHFLHNQSESNKNSIMEEENRIRNHLEILIQNATHEERLLMKIAMEISLNRTLEEIIYV